jgi:hypothetical protein
VGIRDDEKARGGKGRGAEAKATKASGEVEEALGVGWKGAAGQFLEEFESGGAEGGGEGGGPEEGVA